MPLWQKKVLNVNSPPSLSFSASNNAHISYYDSNNESLNYTIHNSGEWESCIFDDCREYVGEQGAPTEYGFSSIILDAAVRVHIVNNCGNDVRYITNR